MLSVNMNFLEFPANLAENTGHAACQPAGPWCHHTIDFHHPEPRFQDSRRGSMMFPGQQMRRGSSLRECQELFDVVPALHQGVLARFEGLLKGPVFHLYAGTTIIANVCEGGKEHAPIDGAQPRQLRRVVFERVGEDSHFRQPVWKDLGVLHMHMKDSILELIDRADIVHVLPQQMRRIIVETETG